MISVIVPVYNVEKYLKDCINSIISQDFDDIELILVDDGSTDDSGSICDEYAQIDNRVRVFHKRNGGLSSARNMGIDKAEGEWLIFVDSDDLWGDTGCLKYLYNYANSLNLDILRFEYTAVNEDLKIIPVGCRDKSMIKGKVLSNYEMVRYAIGGEWFACLYLIRKNALGDLHFDENVKFQEDIDLYCRLFSGKELKCGYIAKPLYIYRKRSCSLTTSPKIENLKCSFNLCDKFFHCSKYIKDENLRDLYQYYSVMMYYWTLGTLTENPYYLHRTEILGKLNLIQLHTRTRQRLKGINIDWKYFLFIIPRPVVGVRLLRLKNKIVKILKK